MVGGRELRGPKDHRHAALVLLRQKVVHEDAAAVAHGGGGGRVDDHVHGIRVGCATIGCADGHADPAGGTHSHSRTKREGTIPPLVGIRPDCGNVKPHPTIVILRRERCIHHEHGISACLYGVRTRMVLLGNADFASTVAPIAWRRVLALPPVVGLPRFFIAPRKETVRKSLAHSPSEVAVIGVAAVGEAGIGDEIGTAEGKGLDRVTPHRKASRQEQLLLERTGEQ